MGGGSTPVPQPTPAPPSGEPRSSQGGPGKTKSPGPLGPPTPRIKFLGRELELSWKPGSQGERAVTLRLHSVPPPTQQLRMARKGGGGESRGRRVAVGKAAGPLRSLPAPPHQLSRQVPGTPKTSPPPQSLLEPQLRLWGVVRALPKSWPPRREYLPTWRFSEKVFKKFGSPPSAPKSEGSQENLSGTTPSLRSHGEVATFRLPKFPSLPIYEGFLRGEPLPQHRRGRWAWRAPSLSPPPARPRKVELGFCQLQRKQC
ncbi:nascent polypeptide-associated complex subunit alpha, muscle-specific form-like isoform X1 [Panthera tigris]|uniref:nascent polypeptide-associated complex subunit alpha, muscle-specific form-like isoform X1 n=1 Tax=Panthera tigris TaxID=9694 RepID=UPI001C6F60AE|nr:nascent polypeptide-associated complex subunit alpha, muscle-specific form-like isoform X1 [Panthera tigris]